MDRDTQARKGQQRAIAVFEKRPDSARVTNQGEATVEDGLACTFSDGGHALEIDMPEGVGGGGSAPTPGYFGRAAICSCIAIGIKMTALRENLTLHRIRVSVDQDFDNRGVLGMPGASPVPSDTRISIEIASHEPTRRIEDIVDKALQIDPWYLAFKEAQPVRVNCMALTEVA